MNVMKVVWGLVALFAVFIVMPKLKGIFDALQSSNMTFSYTGNVTTSSSTNEILSQGYFMIIFILLIVFCLVYTITAIRSRGQNAQ